MSSPETRLVARLKALNTPAGARVWPEASVPQGAERPYIAFQLISGVPVNHAGGATSTKFRRYQLDLVADTHDGARALAEAVEGDPEDAEAPTGLSGWTDADGRLWNMENEIEDSEPLAGGTGQTEAHVVRQDYLV